MNSCAVLASVDMALVRTSESECSYVSRIRNRFT
jgi:hypothetical protein